MKIDEQKMNNERVLRAFENPDWYLDRFAVNIRIRVETIKAFLRGQYVENVLDLGCGDGSLSTFLLNNSTSVTFVERSSAMLEKVAKNLPQDFADKAVMLRGDLMEIPLRPESFDLVICVGVLAYVEDLELLAIRARQLLKRHGMLIIECTDSAHPLSKYKALEKRVISLFKPRRFQTFDHRAKMVLRSFSRAGFELKQSYRYTYTLPLVSHLLKHGDEYKLIRGMFGASDRNRFRWLGGELLMLFRLP
jgi:SAM-dependent methyltransferase